MPSSTMKVTAPTAASVSVCPINPSLSRTALCHHRVPEVTPFCQSFVMDNSLTQAGWRGIPGCRCFEGQKECRAVPLSFPFADYWSFYAAFSAFVLLLLAVDLGVFHRTAHAVSFRESLASSIVWVTIALLFNYGFYRYASAEFGAERGQQLGLEFLTGYIVEKSLAVDNVFVFVLVFSYFSIPAAYQHRVLFYGIIGALVFRAIFIAIGSALMQI